MVNISANPLPHLAVVFSNRFGGVWQHRFTFPGMAFWLHLGTFPRQLPAFCAVRSGVVLYVKDLETNVEREMGSLIPTSKPLTALCA